MRSIPLSRPSSLEVDAATRELPPGIEVTEVELVCIDIHPVTDLIEPVTTEGCEVLELPTEVIINDYPISVENWCEIVPVRRSPQPIKEICHAYRTGT